MCIHGTCMEYICIYICKYTTLYVVCLCCMCVSTMNLVIRQSDVFNIYMHASFSKPYSLESKSFHSYKNVPVYPLRSLKYIHAFLYTPAYCSMNHIGYSNMHVVSFSIDMRSNTWAWPRRSKKNMMTIIIIRMILWKLLWCVQRAWKPRRLSFVAIMFALGSICAVRITSTVPAPMKMSLFRRVDNLSRMSRQWHHTCFITFCMHGPVNHPPWPLSPFVPSHAF